MINNMAHHRLHKKWAEIYGPLYRFRFVIYQVVVIIDPSLAFRVLKSDRVDKWDFIMDPIKDWMQGENLLTNQTDSAWRSVRKTTAPGFSPARLRAASPDLCEVVRKLANILEEIPDGTSFDMEKLLMLTTLDSIGRFAFEQDLQNVQRFGEAVEAGKKDLLSGTLAELLLQCTKYVDRNFRFIAWRHRFWRKDVQDSRKAYAAWREVLRRVLAADEQNPASEGSVISLLRGVKDLQSGKALSRNCILSEMQLLLFAEHDRYLQKQCTESLKEFGSDSTGHQMSFVLYLLSQHKEVEEKVMAELHALQDSDVEIKSGARGIGYEDLRRLPYLQAVIKETARLKPAVGPGQTFIVKKDLQLTEDLLVPKGVIFSIPHYAMFTNPLLWPNNNDFIPERWSEAGHEFYVPGQIDSGLSEQAKLVRDTDIGDAVEGRTLKKAASDSTGRALRYMPFGGGPRDCAGKEFAKVMMPIVLANLLLKFSFTLAPEMGGAKGVEESEVTTLVTGTANGMFMQLHKRKQRNGLH